MENILKSDVILSDDQIKDLLSSAEEFFNEREDRNKQKFIDKYCENRDFLINILEENIYYFNGIVKQKVFGENSSSASFLFFDEFDKKAYGIKDMDIFLDEIEEGIKKAIQKDIEIYRKKIRDLQYLLELEELDCLDNLNPDCNDLNPIY